MRTLEKSDVSDPYHTPQVALVVENLPVNAGDIRDVGLIPGSGRSPGEGNGNSLQYSCLENPMDRGDWQATVHRVTKSQAGLKQFSIDTYNYSKYQKEQSSTTRQIIINTHTRVLFRRRQWHPTPVLLPGKSHGWRSLVGCHLWGCTESDTTEATQQQQQHPLIYGCITQHQLPGSLFDTSLCLSSFSVCSKPPSAFLL